MVFSNQDNSTEKTELSFMIYNMTGADSYKCHFVKDICYKYDINFCGLQEHFKTIKTTESWFRQEFKEFHTHVLPAYRIPGTDCGRGKGGLVQISDKSLKISKKIIAFKSKRIQAQILNFKNCKILWINCYFPCDPQNSSADHSELIETLSELENIVISNDDCEAAISGDLNFDTRRDNTFTRTVRNFMAKMNLNSAWESFPPDYTHIHTDGHSTSIIDHFLLSKNLMKMLVSCEVIHRGDNLSRHSPVILKINLSESVKKETPSSNSPRRVPAWNSAKRF